MTIVIAGTIDFAPEVTTTLLQDAKPLIEAALREDGCIHYNWSLDQNVPGRVHVFEEWTNEAALQGHFDGAPYRDMGGHLEKAGMIGFDVSKYRFDLKEPVYDEAGTPRADFFTA